MTLSLSHHACLVLRSYTDCSFYFTSVVVREMVLCVRFYKNTQFLQKQNINMNTRFKAEAQLGLSQTSMIDSFAKTVNSEKPLTIVTKLNILDVYGNTGCVFVFQCWSKSMKLSYLKKQATKIYPNGIKLVISLTFSLSGF